MSLSAFIARTWSDYGQEPTYPEVTAANFNRIETGVAAVTAEVLALEAALPSTYQPISAELSALAGLSSTGYVKRTGAGAWSVGAIPAADLPSIALTGEATGSGASGSIAVTLTTASVTGKALTGLPAVTNVAIGAGDSILAAMAKLQGQINDKPSISFSRTAKTFFAAPNAANGAASWRLIVASDLPTSGVTAGAYGSASVVPVPTVDAYGRVTGMSTATITPAAIGAQVAGSYESSIAAGTTAQYWRGDKTWQALNASSVGLGNVLNVAQEPALGNPGTSGWVLSSTAAGARSWVALPTLASLGAQAALGFTPVQQGGGTSQTTNKIYIGWSAANALRLQVDTTDFGSNWPISISGYAAGGSADSAKLGGQLPSYYAPASSVPLASSTIPAALGTAAVGTGTTWARADHVHAMPTAAQVGAESALGNPGTNGYLLSSTSAGVRSWVAPYSHPATHPQSTVDSANGWITTALAGKQVAGSYQPLEDQRLSTTNSPSFSGIIVGKGGDTSNYTLVAFNTERPWRLGKSGTGGSTQLHLMETSGNKTFAIGYSSDSLTLAHRVAEFGTHNSAGSGSFVALNAPVTVNGNLTATNLIRSGGTSAQFLKADGSVDSNAYALSSALSSHTHSEITTSRIAAGCVVSDSDTWVARKARGNHFGRIFGVSGAPGYFNYLMLTETVNGFYSAIGFSSNNGWTVIGGQTGENSTYNTLWHTGNLTGDQSAHYHSADRAWGNITGVPANVQNPGAYYLPLAGGTLTGSLTGTSATFVGNVTLSGNDRAISMTSGYLASVQTANAYATGSLAGDVLIGSGSGRVAIADQGSIRFSISATEVRSKVQATFEQPTWFSSNVAITGSATANGFIHSSYNSNYLLDAGGGAVLKSAFLGNCLQSYPTATYSNAVTIGFNPASGRGFEVRSASDQAPAFGAYPNGANSFINIGNGTYACYLKYVSAGGSNTGYLECSVPVVGPGAGLSMRTSVLGGNSTTDAASNGKIINTNGYTLALDPAVNGWCIVSGTGMVSCSAAWYFRGSSRPAGSYAVNGSLVAVNTSGTWYVG